MAGSSIDPPGDGQEALPEGTPTPPSATSGPSDPTPATHQPASRRGGWQPPSPEELQAQIPQFRILGLLGRGGMGAVYKGWQVSLDRHVAIKILPPDIDEGDAQFTARFKQEAKTMARFQHPGIVGVYDAGETSSGLLYIVMEFIEGTDVAQMVKSQGRLPPAHALAITAHVCDALAYAHEHGVIHRDVKPANIMMNLEGQVKVADFGLAKGTEAGQGGLTKTHMAMGTPDYVAPEALIAGMHVDHRADLYAIGVMLHNMLTGEIPRGMFRPASQKVGSDPRFDKIIAKAMEQERERRYQSAREIRQDLDVILTTPEEKAGQSPEQARSVAVHRKPVARVPGSGPGAPASRPAASEAPPQRGARQSPAGKDAGAPRKKSNSTTIAAVVGVLAALAVGAFLVIKPTTPDGTTSAPATAGQPQGSAPGPVTRPEGSATPPAPAPTPKTAPALGKPELPKPPAPSSGITTTKPVAPPPAMPAPAVAVAPAAPPSTPAIPSPAPKVMPAAAPRSELDQRLAALEAGFQAAVERDAGATFKAGIAALDRSYLGALDRALAAATSAGKLEDALALREEKQRIGKGEGVPSELDESTHIVPVRDTLKTLRKTYRSTAAQHEAAKAKALQPLYEKYDQALAAVQTDLTKANNLDDAQRVKAVRDRIAQSSRGLQTAMASQPPNGLKPPTTLAPDSTLPKDVFTNSLGMKFVPVPGTNVLFCVHETRRQDYAAYANEVPGVNGEWRQMLYQGIPVGDKEDHPVVSVNWEDAQAFCAWLSRKEGKTYRLPTDEEWSIAVGLGRKEKRDKDSTPETLNGKELTEFPWGGDSPPKTEDQAGNYADTTWKENFPTMPFIEGYTDGFVTTAPVMKFKPNKQGLYDLGGNVWELVDDWGNASRDIRFARGGSFEVTHARGHLLSSYRAPVTPPTRRYSATGFRCVLATSRPAPSAVATPSVTAPPPPIIPPPATTTPQTGANPATATKEKPFINSLGMKFVPVRDTDVLFCIHETRHRDYAAYAAEMPNVDPSWKEQTMEGFAITERAEDHPVTKVSWTQVQPFCAWLSKKEGRTYRLPTDREWSFAVGIGREEKWKADTTPATVARSNDFPWGDKWPPPRRFGNYADESLKKMTQIRDPYIIPGLDDGFPTTAPVMSFKPNKFGLYDLGGNVWEWVEDMNQGDKGGRVYRGAAWNTGISSYMHSSSRLSTGDYYRGYSVGFRIVLAVSGSAPATAPPP